MDIEYYLEIGKSFLEANFVYVIFAVASLIILIIFLVFIGSYLRKRKPAENIDELESYIKEEFGGGMSKEDIEKNLEKSGWSKKEIDLVFTNLGN